MASTAALLAYLAASHVPTLTYEPLSAPAQLVPNDAARDLLVAGPENLPLGLSIHAQLLAGDTEVLLDGSHFAVFRSSPALVVLTLLSSLTPTTSCADPVRPTLRSLSSNYSTNSEAFSWTSSLGHSSATSVAEEEEQDSAWFHSPVGLFRTSASLEVTSVNARFMIEAAIDAGAREQCCYELTLRLRELGEEREVELDLWGGRSNLSRWVFVRLAPDIKDGETVGYLGVISNRSVSKLKEVQQAAASAVLLNEWCGIGLATLDITGKILSVNESWRKIVFVEVDSTVDPNVWPCRVLEEDREEILVAWHAAIASGDPFKRSIRTVAGQVLQTIAARSKDDTGWNCSLTDITAQCELQKRASEEAELRISDALDQKRQQELLVDVTSHEIRTPTSCILQNSETATLSLVQLRSSLADVLSSDALAELDENIESLEAITECAMAQVRIANDILGLAAIQGNVYSIAPIAVDLAASLHTTVRLFRTECKTKHIDLELVLGDSLVFLPQGNIMVDSVRVGQVLMNLISNAIRFTASTGRNALRKVTISVHVSSSPPVGSAIVAPIQTEAFEPGTPVYIYLECRDTGIGMTEEEQTRLFQYLSQASPMTHSVHQGSGIGLFVAKKLCELMDGAIECVSKPSEGSRFNCYIKAAAVDLDTAFGPLSPSLDIPRRMSSSPPTKSLSILICEDNTLSQRILRRQLERAGHSVEGADNGEEGLQRISDRPDRPFDCVLMDIEMPVLDGLATTRRIREAESLVVGHGRLSVIGLTGNAREGQISKALSAGLCEVVTKPYCLRSLLSLLQRLPDGKQMTPL